MPLSRLPGANLAVEVFSWPFRKPVLPPDGAPFLLKKQSAPNRQNVHIPHARSTFKTTLEIPLMPSYPLTDPQIESASHSAVFEQTDVDGNMAKAPSDAAAPSAEGGSASSSSSSHSAHPAAGPLFHATGDDSRADFGKGKSLEVREAWDAEEEDEQLLVWETEGGLPARAALMPRQTVTGMVEGELETGLGEVRGEMENDFVKETRGGSMEEEGEENEKEGVRRRGGVVCDGLLSQQLAAGVTAGVDGGDEEMGVQGGMIENPQTEAMVEAACGMEVEVEAEGREGEDVVMGTGGGGRQGRQPRRTRRHRKGGRLRKQ
uniref:Uncharacterized protein n=1 Tax=Chromera velia CCMP2878 TaxID=1169474 RepID=A0A0G4I5A9_9ALVE|eukprot:Cvel_1847.t1-p1 / transcript=Cvel_1847.t1 / gene=Cvel_1847 / organism=Chromera_velia_CCMP2878 / gene_product=hypothetical protein / transcript_product=hypothetical protein / location=Cvel_scaffold68:107478-110724(+) / protein_length=318 / sequence_SO=supercontig / SO=protein_coding / is_pseudo=false